MAMTEEQIDTIQKNMMKSYVDAPIELEERIKDTAEKTAGILVYQEGRKAEFEFNDTVYEAKLKKTVSDFKEIIYMVILDEKKLKSAGGHYVPFTVSAEVDNSFSYYENVKAMVEAFLRHITGTIQPEVLPN